MAEENTGRAGWWWWWRGGEKKEREARKALEAVAPLTSEAVFTCGNFIREVRQRTGQ